jgi:hypothetical protein
VAVQGDFLSLLPLSLRLAVALPGRYVPTRLDTRALRSDHDRKLGRKERREIKRPRGENICNVLSNVERRRSFERGGRTEELGRDKRFAASQLQLWGREEKTMSGGLKYQLG